MASYIRTKISYELIRSHVACIGGSRGLWKKPVIDIGECEVVDTASGIEYRRSAELTIILFFVINSDVFFYSSIWPHFLATFS